VDDSVDNWVYPVSPGFAPLFPVHPSFAGLFPISMGGGDLSLAEAARSGIYPPVKRCLGYPTMCYADARFNQPESST
jgi:hypothetical protein